MKIQNFWMIHIFLFLTTTYLSPCRSQNYNATNNGDLMMTINTSGNDIIGSSGSISYSMGQVFYNYTVAHDYTLDQGIQHINNENTLEVKENATVTQNEIILFPNPVIDIVNLNIDDLNSEKGKQFYQLYDLQGKLVKENIIENFSTQINLTNLKSAMYIFSVYCDNKVLKTFKIIKN